MEEQNSDNNYEYDEESFDNGSSEEEISSDAASISEESSSISQSMDELPDNTSIKSLPNSEDNSQTVEENFHESFKISSAEAKKTQVPNEEPNEVKKDDETKMNAEKNSHEIDESESEEAEEEFSESVKSLTIQSNKSTLEPEVPAKGPDLDKNNAEEQMSSNSESEIEFVVTSQTPTSFNSENYAFHMDIKPSRSNTSIQQQKSRNAHRKSLSFSNERMREIERHNQILLRKILTQKPRKDIVNQKNQCSNLRMTTSAVNRKKQQRQIDLDNQVLKRKIEAIALRRPQIL